MRKILFLLCVLSLAACKGDFDEVADTDQRSIRFNVNTSHCFDKVLSYHDNEFSLGYAKQIQPTHRLRLVSYCYDEDGCLLNSQTQYYEQPQDAQVLFKHLQKQMTYRFVFIADIVKYDATFNCYETWYQLCPQSFSEMYLATLEEDEAPEYNAVLSSVIDLKPANQTADVALEPQTWNGYLNFTNVAGVDRIVGYYTYYRSFYFESKEKRGKLYTHNYDIFLDQHNSNAVLPITVSIANDLMLLKSSVVTMEGVQDTLTYHYDKEHTPFVITLDCKTNEIKYENYH